MTVVVLFCFSGFGIYATFVEAMSGDSSILLSKAVRDLVTAMVFAITLRDFIACAGILTVAAGLRVTSIKNTAITNRIPAMLLVMPLSWLWPLLPW